MEHGEIRELIPAFAIGAVDADERRAVERHVDECAECRHDLEQFRSAHDSMAAAVEPADLPTGFVDRVVNLAVGEKDLSVRRARRWRGLAVAFSAAVVAAAIVIGVTVVESRNDAETQQRVLRLLASNEGIPLTGDGDVIARVAATDDGSRFAIAGIEAAPEGKTYQLWLMRGEGCPATAPRRCELVSAGTFDTEDGVALLELDHEVAEWEDAAVTLEPDPGSEAPTTTPFADSL